MLKSATAKDNTNQLLVARRRRLKMMKYMTSPFPTMDKMAMIALTIQYQTSCGSSEAGVKLCE